ncbi:hypothetical protein HDU92_003592 [Lobulomyces angularis]|nr:hypothetical protein HDU92_003592 [Lobulomyces angularis]
MTSDGEVVGATYPGSLVNADGKILRKPNSVDDLNIKKSGEPLFVLKPLKEISLITDQATRFDFSALKDREKALHTSKATNSFSHGQQNTSNSDKTEKQFNMVGKQSVH